MPLNASRSPSRKAALAALTSVVVAAALGAGSARAQEAEVTAPESVVGAPPFVVQKGRNALTDHFPNVVLKTHDGRNVRFFDDLLKGKIVMINFMYANCKGR